MTKGVTYSGVVIKSFTDMAGVSGEAVGDCEGAEVGASVGEFDGSAVGDEVLHSGDT